MINKAATSILRERTLIQRINRKLTSEGQRVRKSRSQNQISIFGPYYLLDLNRDRAVCYGFNLEDSAREMNCMRPSEAVDRLAD